jgi:hypothetical protein
MPSNSVRLSEIVRQWSQTLQVNSLVRIVRQTTIKRMIFKVRSSIAEKRITSYAPVARSSWGGQPPDPVARNDRAFVCNDFSNYPDHLLNKIAIKHISSDQVINGTIRTSLTKF